MNWHRMTWLLPGALLVVLFAVAAAAQTATLTTDKPGYAPGEIVTITGSGWMPGETVVMILHEDPALDPDHLFTSVADANGVITNSEFSPDAGDVGVDFTVSATGSTSGWTAEAIFSDDGIPQNPVPQGLPYSQDFNDLSWDSGCGNNTAGSCPPLGESWPAGWQGWRVATNVNTVFVTNAPFADENLRRNGSAGVNAGGVYNYLGKLGFLSSNTSNPALVLALNTVGQSCIRVSFDIMTIRNPWSGDCSIINIQGNRTNDVDLQYQIGASGSGWVSVSGNPDGIYQSVPGPKKIVAGDISPQNLQTVSLALPPACWNQPVVQLRWLQKDRAGQCGPRPSFALDNVTVSNPPPVATITGPASGEVVSVNVSVPFTGSFTDNTGDTHTAQWYFDGVPAGDPVTISGDGTGSGTISMTHAFAAAGVYMVSLKVTDQCSGASTTSQVGGLDAMVVVYDPSAGFVTGGGWIDSPAGACLADPGLTGKANFGFVSKYKKGATIPTGETEFQFKASEMNFHSTSYSWLVISGARAQYKGSGTINGAGGYSFMLTASDGDLNGQGVDKFRIKISDVVTGAMIYDNQLGASDNSSPSTALGSGSIVIHSSSLGIISEATMRPETPVQTESQPAVFTLGQGFPNPFRASTDIRFSLPERSTVRLAIYDIHGREIACIADGGMEPGNKLVTWSGRDQRGNAAPGGVYFVRMTARSLANGARFTSTKRVSLLN